MLATCALLALLWLPGLAVLRLWAPRELARGALSAIALGYAATLALLSPWSLACYLLRLPAWTFSAGTACAIAAGAFALIRARAWRALTRPDAVGAAGAALLVLQLALAARVGGWLDGDATYHLGRIRDLLEHGFSNRDFYLAEPSGNPAYAFNLLHALYAAAAQLTAQDMLVVWSAALPWAQLLIAAGHYHLAQIVFDSRLAGWIAAVVTAVLRAPESYAIYPNLLAVGWLAPVLLAYLCNAQTGERPRGAVALAAMLALVLGQTHALYFGLVVLVAAPLLAARVAAALAVRAPSRARRLAPYLAALLAGAPFVAAARYAPPPTPEQVQSAAATASIPYQIERARPAGPRSHADQRADTPALAAGGGHLEKQLDRRDGAWFMPVQRAGGAAFVALGLLAFVPCALRLAPRRAAIAALGVAASTLLLIPLSPALCTFFAEHLLPPFAVARMVTLAASLLVAALAAAIAEALQALGAGAALQSLALLLLALGATPVLGHAPRTYAEHLRQALAPAAARHALLEQHRAWRALLRAHVPAGELVLASLRDGRYAAMLHDVRVVAVDRGHGKLPGLAVRRDHVELLTAGKTRPALRARLLDHHRVRYVVYRSKYAKRFRWARAHGRLLGRSAELEVVQLDQRGKGG